MNKIDKTVLKETKYIACWVLFLSMIAEAVFLIIGKWNEMRMVISIQAFDNIGGERKNRTPPEILFRETMWAGNRAILFPYLFDTKTHPTITQE